MKIKNMTFEDLHEVFEISKEAFEANSWTFKLFEEELNTQSHYAFVGLEENKIVCFLSYMITEGEKGLGYNILNIATEKSKQNKGYATKLLNFLKQNAKQNNYNELWLEVRNSNTNAITFYKNFGFETDYVRKHYYANGEDAIIMSLKI